MELKAIARIYNDYHEKFGVPRQSGLVQNVISRIEFEPEYRDANMLRGLEEYDYIWLLWEFSEHAKREWHPTVRPPRLGGNKRVGVLATRTSFRPNPIGLSCVFVERIEREGKKGPVIYVRGADIVNGTPIFDIKPYLPYVDAHPDARGGFAEEKKNYRLEVVVTPEAEERLLHIFTKVQLEGLCELLAQDPRPSYQDDRERLYGICYGGYDVQFQIVDGKVWIK